MAVLAQAAFAASPPVATGITVDQLDQILLHVSQQSDTTAARQLAALKLVERASAIRLERWQTELPGPRAHEALLALADASAFLPLPAAETPAAAGPDEISQKQILARMVEYVKQVFPRLPNFSALRSTTSFEVATPDQMNFQQVGGELLQLRQQKRKERVIFHALGAAKSSGLPDGQLFWTGFSTQPVTYRNGSEVTELSAGTAGHAGHVMFGLTTAGEFGPMLGIILNDGSTDEMVWDHWEQGAIGPLAVFRYAVPRERSHFAVEFAADEQPEFPAFHGEIAVDPATGAVFRITILGNVQEQDFLHDASIVVEFAPTEIAGVTYICPVRGVAIEKTLSPFAELNAQPPPIPYETYINDISFTKYHVFRTESRVVSGASVP